MGSSCLEAKLTQSVALMSLLAESSMRPDLCTLHCSWAIHMNKRSMCAQVFCKFL